MSRPLKIAFARRGFSATGGAEAYLRRLAGGLAEAGHAVQLWTTGEWPASAWPFGAIQRIGRESPRGFADEVEAARASGGCDLLFSLERVWRCDIFRAGDGVHAAWLARRGGSGFAKWLRARTGKHREILQLERALLRDAGAARVIANSAMVRDEIVEFYGYDAAKIDLVPNGVPVAQFAPDAELRAQKRAELGLAADDIVVLFAGSGWERKGLAFAIAAIAVARNPKLRLWVAGRGNAAKFRRPLTQFLGPVADLRPLYSAADIFLLPTLYDPFSNASLEALAAGLPVITTRANGCGEVIAEGIHGSVVPNAADLDALAGALRFWSSTERRETARPAILARAAEFDIARNVERTAALLAQAASALSTSGKMRNT